MPAKKTTKPAAPRLPTLTDEQIAELSKVSKAAGIDIDLDGLLASEEFASVLSQIQNRPESKTAEPTSQPSTIDDDADVEMIAVEWNGRTWTVPADDGDWDFQALEALEDGKGIAFLRAVLGRRQFAQFGAGTRRTARDANELMATIMASFGEARQGE